MYYQHGYPLDGAGLVLRSQSQGNSRTGAYSQYQLITSPPPEKVKKSFAEKLVHHPSWVYQPYYHVPRVSPAYNRIPPHQSQKSPGYYYYYQHPNHPSSGWQERQEFCSCPDYIYGTSSRRSKTGRCKRCHCKRIAFDEIAQHGPPSTPTTPQQAYVPPGSVRIQRQSSSRTPIPRNLMIYRDPYDYVRRSSSSRPNENYYSEEWQNYWESSDVSTFKRSVSPASPSTTSTSNQQPMVNGVDVNTSRVVNGKSVNGSIPVVSPTVPEAKREDQNMYNLVTIKNSNNNKTVQISRVQIIDDNPTPSRIRPLEKGIKKEATDEEDLMNSPDIEKLKAVAEQRHGNNSRFSRKIQIDDIILEENEEDLEMENLEIISSTPVVKEKMEERMKRGEERTKEEQNESSIPGGDCPEIDLSRKVRFMEDRESLLIDLIDPADGEEREETEEEKEEQISDELSGFDPQLILSSQNLADEILTEIYGKKSPSPIVVEKDELNQSHSVEISPKEQSTSSSNEKDGGGSDEMKNSLKDFKRSASSDSINPAIVEFARRFTANSSIKGRRASSPSGITRTNSINGRGDYSKENAMSQLFNDTTRIRLQKQRRRPLSLFSPEFPPRPKDPPPPPPPISPDPSEGDEFSSDEFSEDSFDEEEYGERKYANLSEDRLPPEGAESDQISADKNHLYDLAETMSADGILLSSHEEKANRSTSRAETSLPSHHPSLLAPQKDESECKILISSSSWINVEGEKKEEEDEALLLSSEEPIKPPRLKKIARQKKQGGISPSRHYSIPEHEYVNCAMYTNRTSELRRSSPKKSKPEISAPILVATTFNPNDAENHKTLSPRDSLQRNFSSSSSSSPDKITFKDIKKFARSISSFTSGLKSFDSSQQEDYPPSEHIYEEISDDTSNPSRPLPPIPEKRDGSFFEGASKYEILRYLKNAKDRIGHSDFEIELSENNLEYESSSVSTATTMTGSSSTTSGVSGGNNSGGGFIGKRNQNHRVSAISNVSDSSNSSSGDSTSSGSELLILRGCTTALNSAVDIERTDSGVGSETSKSSKSRISATASVPSRTLVTSEDEEEEDEEELEVEEEDFSKETGMEETHYCLDCNEKLHTEDDISTNDRLSMIVCSKCAKRRSERKETITEIIETEIKYGRDLRIIVEEFYRPMLVAGLLNSEQLSSIFLNAEELISHWIMAMKISRLLILESFSSSLYPCSKHLNITALDKDLHPCFLTTLEKEKELLRIFLKVSQMENSMLRRMNLSSFLMVPVQRVTKYPLLLSRLHRVTLVNHEDRSSIKLAQEKIEESLEQMNKEAKDVNPNKIWKRLPKMSTPSPTKTIDIQAEMGNVRIRKMALDLLGWNRDEIRFPLERKNSGTIKDASLLLVREKNSRFTLVRDPLPLDRCVVCCDPDWDDCFEIQEFVSKESFVFKVNMKTILIKEDGGSATTISSSDSNENKGEEEECPPIPSTSESSS
ncbi:unnamed protein product [Lepeophtheirus salmonis]|uniref:(salmon louse) hypothetical protein n=1 Tax=Lepeophtheirus salmonis TaxID=72036 RepID=A0A7R8D4N9_LEPSM|nr:unnamed protein product [Lepeophtheirus salmonis]CAF2997736.1 unnamed protein product [Lepeophtheirus salmonis]